MLRQEEFHDRLLELQHQNRQAKDELIHCRDEVAQLERALGQKTAEIQRIAREVGQRPIGAKRRGNDRKLALPMLPFSVVSSCHLRVVRRKKRFAILAKSSWRPMVEGGW